MRALPQGDSCVWVAALRGGFELYLSQEGEAMTEFYDDGPKWVGGVSDPALVALGESRARYGDLEARLVEAEAVIVRARAAVPISAADAWDVLSTPPSVVLADHDAAVRSEALREAMQIADETSDTFGNLYRIDYINRLEHEIALAEGQPNA